MQGVHFSGCVSLKQEEEAKPVHREGEARVASGAEESDSFLLGSAKCVIFTHV